MHHTLLESVPKNKYHFCRPGPKSIPSPPKLHCRTLCGPPFINATRPPPGSRQKGPGPVAAWTADQAHPWPTIGGRPPAVIIGHVSREHPSEMVLAEHHHLVQALPPNAPDEALRIRILPGTPRGRAHLMGTLVLKQLVVESSRESIPRRRPPFLPRRSPRARASCGSAPMDARSYTASLQAPQAPAGLPSGPVSILAGGGEGGIEPPTSCL